MSENEIMKADQNKDLEADFFDGGELGDGFEETSADDQQVNFLRVAQKENADPEDEKYIPGIEAGDFFDTTEKTNFGKKLKIVVLHFNTTWVEWGAEQLGDYRNQYTKEEFQNLTGLKNHPSKLGTKITAEGTHIVETKNYFCYLPDYLDKGILLFCLSSSGVKLSKMWESKFSLVKHNGKKASRYSSLWEVSTQLAKSEKHKKSWYAIGDKSGVNAEFVSVVPKENREEVIALRNIIKGWVDAGLRVNYKSNTEDNSNLEDEI